MHVYKFDDETFPSVTTILGQLSKGDSLMQWAVDKSFEVGDRLGWKNYRTKTADLGSELHALIEAHINARLNENSLDIEIIRKQFNEAAIPMYMQFLVWEKNNVKKWIESEQPIFHFCKGFAGTCDMIFEDINGEIVLCDLKTSNDIYKEAELQVSAYLAARESMVGGFKVTFSDGKSSWNKELFYKGIKISKCAVLMISRDFFDLKYKVIKDHEMKYESFLGLVKYYYYSAKRRVKNQITKELY